MLIIKIHNDSTGDHSKNIGNYNISVYINSRIIATGRVENHNRADGWRELLKKVADMEDEITKAKV